MNIYYFVGNLPVQGIHAQTIFEKLGGTFVVWSKEAKEFCTQKKWPVIMWNTYQEQNHLFIEPDKVSETIFYLNQNQNIIFFLICITISLSI